MVLKSYYLHLMNTHQKIWTIYQDKHPSALLFKIDIAERVCLVGKNPEHLIKRFIKVLTEKQEEIVAYVFKQ